MPDTLFDEKLAFSLAGKAGLVHRLFRQVVTIAVAPLGLTQPRWLAMVHIDHLGEGCSQHALAQSIHIEMPSLTRTLKQLEESAVIERRVCGHDKRSRQLYFTAKGKALLNDLNERVHEIKPAFYADLSAEQLNTTAQTLAKLEQNACRLINEEEGK